jgi:hypothetical protein
MQSIGRTLGLCLMMILLTSCVTNSCVKPHRVSDMSHYAAEKLVDDTTPEVEIRIYRQWFGATSPP